MNGEVARLAELADLTVQELLDLYERNQASPVEAVESCLRRIEAVDPRVGAIVTLRDTQCLSEARWSERRWRQGDQFPLDGIPFGLKDIIETAGILTTGGSQLLRDHIPSSDAAVATRLREAGALLIAKLHTHEFASGENLVHGPARNPWNLEYSPGGSSSGSAVAVASREIPFSIGTDTGGSIRVPAAFCGVVGMKPTYGRVPRTGVMPLSWTLDTVGPLTRTVEDAAIVLSVIAGHDPSDPTSARDPVPDYRTLISDGVTGIRLGLLTGWFAGVCDRRVRDVITRAVSAIESAGAVVEEVELPSAEMMQIVGRTIIESEAASLHRANWDRLTEYSPDLATRITNGQSVLAVDYLHALRTRHLIQRDLEVAFRNVDALIAPTTVCTPPRLDTMEVTIDGEPHHWKDVVARTTRVFSVAGTPAISVPSGWVGDLPVGIQVVAPPHDDALCLRVANAFQDVTDDTRLPELRA